jgi:hypothetical protein
MWADSDRIPGGLPPRTHPGTEGNGDISPLKFPTPDGETQLGWGSPLSPLGLGGTGGTVNITEGGNALRNHPISGLSVVIVLAAIADKR